MTRRTARRFGAVALVIVAAFATTSVLYISQLKSKPSESNLDDTIRESEFELRTRSVESGMDESEVIRVLGEPDERWKPSDPSHFDTAMIYSMQTSEDAIMINLKGGRVTGVGLYTRPLD